MTVQVLGHTVTLGAGVIKETTQTVGTGTYELNGATGAAVSFVTGIGNGNKTLYRAQQGSAWEEGIGTVASGSPPTLARTEIIASSNSDAAVSWPGGTIDIWQPALAALLDQIGDVADMTAWSFKIRNAATTGAPSDAALANITTEAAPGPGDFLIGFLSTGAIRKFDFETVRELRTPIATTSGTAHTYTGIGTHVRRVTVIFQNVSTNGTSPIIVQLGDSGGIETSGYDGCLARVSAASQDVFDFSTGFAIHTGAGVIASTGHNGHVVLTPIGDTNSTWIASITIGQGDTSVQYGGGAKILSGGLTQIRITTVNGSDLFDAGEVNVLLE